MMSSKGRPRRRAGGGGVNWNNLSLVVAGGLWWGMFCATMIASDNIVPMIAAKRLTLLEFTW